MKALPISFRWAAAVLALVLFATASSLCLDRLHAQGGLTPPGAPGPTMKTLAQVEPRTDLATLPGDSTDSVVISAPGSYYLSANLNGVAGLNGISINADNVTVDLNGFAVVCGVSGPNALVGIVDTTQGGHKNISIVNGTVRGWGKGNAYLYSNDVVLRHLRLSNSTGPNGGGYGNGFSGVGDYALIADCIASGNAGNGFSCGYDTVLSNCESNNNTLSGFSGYGIAATNSCAKYNGGAGWAVTANGQLTNCSALNNSLSGFVSSYAITLTGCNGSANTGAGFSCTGYGTVVHTAPPCTTAATALRSAATVR